MKRFGKADSSISILVACLVQGQVARPQHSFIVIMAVLTIGILGWQGCPLVNTKVGTVAHGREESTIAIGLDRRIRRKDKDASMDKSAGFG